MLQNRLTTPHASRLSPSRNKEKLSILNSFDLSDSDETAPSPLASPALETLFTDLCEASWMRPKDSCSFRPACLQGWRVAAEEYLSEPWCAGLFPLKKIIFSTIQISLTTQQQWHSACRESQQSTNIVNSSLISFPFLLFSYLDIGIHVAGATWEHYTAIKLVTTSIQNILNETFH